LHLLAVGAEQRSVRRDRRVADARRIEHERAPLATERYGVRLAHVADRIVTRGVAIASALERSRVEEAPPALARAVAHLVVAAHDDPRRGLEQRPRRREQIGVPGIPAVAPRASAAAV